MHVPAVHRWFSMSFFAVVSFGFLAHCADDGGRSLGSNSGAGGGATETAASSGSSGSFGSAGSTAGGGTGGSGGAGGAGGTGGASGHGGTVGGAGAGGSGVSEPAGIQFFGRWDMTDPANATGSWGPIYLRARFEGTSIGIKLKDASNTFVYSIDGGPMKLLGPTAATEHPLASGLAEGVHSLELARRSEGGFGKTVVGGLILDPGKNVLPPGPRPAHKIEIVGDSISAGYGNEGKGGNTPANENGYLAYGPQLARMLDAEWSVIAHSGQGMYRNGCEALPPMGQHMPDEFKLTQHPFVPGPSWDFDKWKPDVLVIALGTNDFADYPPGSCARPTDDAFKGAYATFLTFARNVYPNAEIFALGTFLSTATNQFGACNQDICNVVEAKKAAGDGHIHCIDPGFTSSSGAWLPDGTNYIGDWTHPTVASHTLVANRLRSIIQPVMGW